MVTEDSIKIVIGENKMPVYKMAYRDGDNPETSKLHMILYFCEAKDRIEADKIFTANFGPKWVLAGPILVESNKVPQDAKFVTMPTS
jgi:hypothetical protein